MNYPLKHISIRVPWHDTGWDGRVCAAPRLNGACLKLKGYSVTGCGTDFLQWKWAEMDRAVGEVAA